MKEAFEKAGLGMMAYMTDLDKVEVDPNREPKEAFVSGEDEQSLLYAFLEELLFLFNTEYKMNRSILRLDSSFTKQSPSPALT